MIAVLDTNVLIAALVTEGACSKLLFRARRRDFFLVTSPFILSEVQRVLARKFRASRAENVSAIRLIREAAHRVVEPNVRVERTCRDPDDDHILACAREAEAEYLVTGDHDLLVMETFRGTRILTPRDFELLFA
ncbi:MAG: putative toxin-antitoxin system toxin component, PIN family [Nitrospirota bacterium]